MRDARYYRAWMSVRTISRRALFRSLLQPGKQALLPAPTTQVWRRQVPRPPQAVVEPLFLQRCDGCGDCVQACAYGIIYLEQQKAQLQVDYADCNLCADCTRACSKDALDATLPMDTGLRPVISSQCLGRLDDGCRMCEIACPGSAIFFNQHHQPVVKNDQCTGCGKCKFVCYHGAITLTIKADFYPG
ncbi:MAG: ferredoxin-type protein NapF [Rouxiella aceris]|jgi:ferredoxin-type protein NapF|uniref:Ferredoxin-type protein NapF n=1 Tax=Rouxiella aceris TaxID=2703884 RepID=A0A848MLP4_9GAMM|nr:ferredoxin-type protein NapF [Rouxiella aceris]MDR3432356.1 ferredoxin-type protein NapF [Rouxiella aceris]NMP27114.1 ferredoxin-type protein NapF [Rouxiella aceris]